MIELKGLGARVRETRQGAGLSQAALAEQAGVTNETISRLERGAFEPSLSTIVAVADALGVELDFLAGRTEATRPPAPRGDPPLVQRLTERARKLDSRALRALVILAELLPEQSSDEGQGGLAAKAPGAPGR